MQKNLMLIGLVSCLTVVSACSKQLGDAPDVGMQTRSLDSAQSSVATMTRIDLAPYVDLKPVDLQRDPLFGPKLTAIVPRASADCVRGALEQLRPLTRGAKGEVYTQGFGSHADNWTEGYIEVAPDGQLDVGVVCSDFATAADRHIYICTTRGIAAPLNDATALWINELTRGEGRLTIFDGKLQKDMAVRELTSSESIDIAGELSAPAVTETAITGESYKSAGGVLAVVEIDYVRKLVWNGVGLGDIEDDHITLEKVYHYADRDVVLVTHACGGSACTFTSFAFVEIPMTGGARVLTNDNFVTNSDGVLPDIAAATDGRLVISFTGFKGKEKWRYSDGMLSKE